MSLNLSRPLPVLPMFFPLGSREAVASFLEEARLPRLPLARPRSLRVGRFTVDVTSVLAHVPLSSASPPPPPPLIPSLSSSRGATGTRFYITFHYSHVPINPSYTALYSLAQRSRSTSARDFYDSFRAASRSIGTYTWRAASSRRGMMIDPLSSLGRRMRETYLRTVRSRS